MKPECVITGRVRSDDAFCTVTQLVNGLDRNIGKEIVDGTGSAGQVRTRIHNMPATKLNHAGERKPRIQDRTHSHPLTDYLALLLMHFVNLGPVSKWTKTAFWSIVFHSDHGWISYIRIAQPQGNDYCVLDRFFPLPVISRLLGITAIMPFYHRWTLISFYQSFHAHEVY